MKSFALLPLLAPLIACSPKPAIDQASGLPIETFEREVIVEDYHALSKRGIKTSSFFSSSWSDGSTSDGSTTSTKTTSSSGSTSDSSSDTPPEGLNLNNIPGDSSGNSELPSPGTQDFDNLLTGLYAAGTAIERYELLGANGVLFNFLESSSFGGGGAAGAVVLADDTIYPATIGNGAAMLMGFLGPCGMVAPHSHPRATELLLLVSGPPLVYGMITEGGGAIYNGTQPPGTVAVLPKGSIHYVMNSGCTPAVLMAGFDNESPGALFLSQDYAAFDSSFYAAAFGENVKVLDFDKIPNAVNIGTASCMKACGLDASTLDVSGLTKQEILLESYATFLDSMNYTWTS